MNIGKLPHHVKHLLTHDTIIPVGCRAPRSCYRANLKHWNAITITRIPNSSSYNSCETQNKLMTVIYSSAYSNVTQHSIFSHTLRTRENNMDTQIVILQLSIKSWASCHNIMLYNYCVPNKKKLCILYT